MMAAKREFKLPTSIPPFVLGLLGVVVILQQTFLASVDRPWLLGAGLTLVGIPVFYRLEPSRQDPPQFPPVAPTPGPSLQPPTQEREQG